jgi:UPF0755 protein
MTIRGGGRPRDASHAHPLDPEPAPWRPPGNGNGRRRPEYMLGRRSEPRHHLRFLVFLLALAALVLIAMVTVLRPIVVSTVVGWADSNPGALKMPFVADLVREDLGAALTQPAGTNADPVQFAVVDGDTPATLAPKLKAQGLIANERAFVFEATLANLASDLKAGNYLIAGNLTPHDVVLALINNRVTVTTIDVTFREGLRLEQIVAKLQTLQSGVDPKTFYDLVTHPPASLVADYPFLKGRGWPTLEGFLYPATFTLRTDAKDPTTAEDLVRMMLDAFKQNAGDLTTVPKSRGLTFPQVLVLASIVEREARLDSERALIAGVYQNRLNPKLFPSHELGSDPTIFYVNDSLGLGKLPFDQWDTWSFWGSLPKGTALPGNLPPALAPYNTYTHPGLPPGPICSPARASIEAALAPDTKDKYLYFIAKNDGSDTTAFAKTYAEHLQNVAKYKQP